MKRRCTAAALCLVLTAGAVGGATGILADAPSVEPAISGTPPSYGPVSPASLVAAADARIWVPGLDDGFDPQGLAAAGGQVLVSGYRSDGLRINRGPCRVYRVDPATGDATGTLDVPAPCGHAGGLAVADDGTLYVADTRLLFATMLDGAFDGRPVFRRIVLGPGLVGAYATASPGYVWIGTYREDGPGRLFRFPTATLAALHDGDTLTASMAKGDLPVPAYAQGAAINGDGSVWIASSDLRWGRLARLDPGTGRALAQFPFPAGTEGIAFDAGGAMWAVSEAGARHVFDHPLMSLVAPFHPLIVRLAPARLPEDPAERFALSSPAPLL